MPFSRDLSQEQLIGYVNKLLKCKTVTNMSGIPGIFFFFFFFYLTDFLPLHDLQG